MLEKLSASLGEKDFDALGFGEVMLRLSPSGRQRISQGDTFDKCAGGSELNVVSGISLLGCRTGMITKLPENEIGDYIKNSIRFCGVSDDYIVYDRRRESRLGVYYYETGAYPRKGTVVYDRRDSAVNYIAKEEMPDGMYSSARLFHTSGISLALGGGARRFTVDMIKSFREAGAVISFDVNYRGNLWGEKEARETIESILPYVDIFFVSEESSRRMFSRTGTLEEIMKGYTREYGISLVATTARNVISPSKHDFSSVIYSAENDEYYREKPYLGIDVVDRLGSGDAYVAGVLYGLLSKQDVGYALSIGNACSALKNTVIGDLPASDLDEVMRTVESHNSDSDKSELRR